MSAIDVTRGLRTGNWELRTEDRGWRLTLRLRLKWAAHAEARAICQPARVFVYFAAARCLSVYCRRFLLMCRCAWGCFWQGLSGPTYIRIYVSLYRGVGTAIYTPSRVCLFCHVVCVYLVLSKLLSLLSRRQFLSVFRRIWVSQRKVAPRACLPASAPLSCHHHHHLSHQSVIVIANIRGRDKKIQNLASILPGILAAHAAGWKLSEFLHHPYFLLFSLFIFCINIHTYIRCIVSRGN